MPRRSSSIAVVILIGTVLLAGCATKTEESVVAAAGPQHFIHLNPPKPRPRRVSQECKLAKVDLPPERKEALFRQFTDQLGTDAPVLPVAVAAGPNDCRQASR
jgi:hypothetical protein